jgi:hypothetical protein
MEADMLKLLTVAAFLVLATPAIAQDGAFGNPNWVPGQSASTLTLYDQSGLQGGKLPLVKREGNLAGSFRVASLSATGGAWEVCDRHNFQGECRVVDGWTLSLNRDIGLRDVRSARPVDADRTARN